MKYLIVVCSLGLLAFVATTQHVPGSPEVVTPPADDCTVSIETEGMPPPGVHLPSVQELCDALHRAEQQAGQY